MIGNWKMNIFIIAEIGINHNGDIEIAKNLIELAKSAGCDAVKFQKRTIDKVYSKAELDKPKESPWGTTNRELKIHLEFNKEGYDEIDRFCRELNIDWFASAWDIDSQLFLRQYNLHYNKIASAMIVYKDLLEMVAQEKKYTFISTGMSTIKDIEQAVDIFKKAGCPYELMHCVSCYPMNDNDANLNCIKTLRDHFQCPVGYSGHEVGLAISYAAAACGASSLERHISLDRSMFGSDQAASLEPAGLRQLVGGIRKIQKAMGDGKVKIHETEIPSMKKLRTHASMLHSLPACPPAINRQS